MDGKESIASPAPDTENSLNSLLKLLVAYNMLDDYLNSKINKDFIPVSKTMRSFSMRSITMAIKSKSDI